MMMNQMQRGMGRPALPAQASSQALSTPRPPAPTAGMPEPSMLPRAMPSLSSSSFEPAFPRAVRHGPNSGAFPGGGATGGVFPGGAGQPQMPPPAQPPMPFPGQANAGQPPQPQPMPQMPPQAMGAGLPPAPLGLPGQGQGQGPQGNPLANMQGPMIDMLRQLFSQRLGGMGGGMPGGMGGI